MRSELRSGTDRSKVPQLSWGPGKTNNSTSFSKARIATAVALWRSDLTVTMCDTDQPRVLYYYRFKDFQSAAAKFKAQILTALGGSHPMVTIFTRATRAVTMYLMEHCHLS